MCQQIGTRCFHWVAKGDRCVSSPELAFFLRPYSVTQIGAVLVPLNYRLTAADHEYIINHAGVEVVLVDHEYTSLVDQIRPQLRTVNHWIVAGDEIEAPSGWVSWEMLIAENPTTATPHVGRRERHP